jgi:hypothetical protein
MIEMRMICDVCQRSLGPAVFMRHGSTPLRFSPHDTAFGMEMCPPCAEEARQAFYKRQIRSDHHN